MLKYVVRRLLVLPLILFLVTVILFVFLLQIPVEQRVLAYLPSAGANLTEERYAELVRITIERYGLDQPAHVQYIRWLRNLAQGDWGYSPSWRQPVLEGALQRAPATLELMLFAIIPAVALSVVLGSAAARRRSKLPDHAVQAASFLVWAFPPFILGLLLMNVLYAWLHWFPPERLSIWAAEVVRSDQFRTYTGLLTVDALLNGNTRLFWDAARHLVLPGLTLALMEWALLTRIMRSSLLDVLRQDYITTARAKGLSEPVVLRRHARRNALLPVISIAGVATSTLMTGVVLVEVVFSFNGLGRWAVEAFQFSEIPVSVAFAMISIVVTVLSTLMADILYAVVDPRIRLFGGERSAG